MANTSYRSTASSDSKETFRYAPLAKGFSIRLLEVEDGEDADMLTCHLRHADLDDDPSFDALSYTWDNPFTVASTKEEFDRVEATYSSKDTILCDGESLQIGMNLAKALKSLRMIRRSRGLFQAHGSFAELSKPLWVDQICINQEDKGERNIQVANMDRIYGAARKVWIWIGAEDNFTRRALQTFQTIAEWNVDQSFSHDARSGLTDEDYTALNSKTISDLEWLSVFAFFSRTWFQRMWTLQEIILANDSTVLCGRVPLPWELIVYILARIHHVALGTMIDYVAIKAAERFTDAVNPSNSGMQNDDTPRLYSNRTISTIFPRALAMAMDAEMFRLWLRGLQQGFQAHEGGFQADLLTLLSSFRQARCKDSRDKVFALVGVLKRIARLSQRDPIIPRVTYEKPAKEIYSEIAESILESTGNLQLFSHVLHIDAQSLNCQTLSQASWVPDWSLSKFWNTIAEENEMSGWKAKWKASGEIPTTVRWTIPDRLLELRGRFVGTVYKVIGYDIGDIDSVWEVYRSIANIFRFGGILPGTTGALPSTWIIKANNYDQSVMFLPSTYDGIQTAFEVLWRTLIGDQWQGQSPAPTAAGKAFAAYLKVTIKNKIKNNVEQRRKVDADDQVFEPQDPDQQQPGLGLTDPSIAAGIAVRNLSISSTIRVAKLDNLKTELEYLVSAAMGLTDLARIEEELINFVQRVFIRERSSPLLLQIATRYLESLYDIVDIVDLDKLNDPFVGFEEDKEADSWVRAVKSRGLMHEQLLFATEEGMLGVGAKCIQTEDQVWVLAGGNVPFVLRKMTNDNFRLVCETYMQPVMQGEWFQGVDDSQLDTIVLE